MASYIEEHGGTISLVGIAVGIGQQVITHFSPTLPDWALWTLAAVAVVLFVVGFAGLFTRRRRESSGSKGNITLSNSPVSARAVIGHDNVVHHSTTVNQAPRPELRTVSRAGPSREENSTFITTVVVEVNAPYIPRRVRIVVNAKNLLDVSIHPSPPVGLMVLTERSLYLAEGIAVHVIDKPAGRYAVAIRTAADTTPTLEGSFD